MTLLQHSRIAASKTYFDELINTNFFHIVRLSPYIFDGLEDILHSQWDDPWCTAVPHHSECLPR